MFASHSSKIGILVEIFHLFFYHSKVSILTAIHCTLEDVFIALAQSMEIVKARCYTECEGTQSRIDQIININVVSWIDSIPQSRPFPAQC